MPKHGRKTQAQRWDDQPEQRARCQSPPALAERAERLPAGSWRRARHGGHRLSLWVPRLAYGCPCRWCRRMGWSAMPDYGHDLLFGAFVTPRAETPDAVLALAETAEQVGLDLFTVQDHPYQPAFLDAWTLLSVVAGRTQRVRLLPNVTNLPLRPPAVLARAVASLDILSAGRVELGLGAGGFWDAIAAMGGRADRLARRWPRSAERSMSSVPCGRREPGAHRGNALPPGGCQAWAIPGPSDRNLGGRIPGPDAHADRPCRRRWVPSSPYVPPSNSAG